MQNNIQDKWVSDVIALLTNSIFPHISSWLENAKGVVVTPQELASALNIKSPVISSQPLTSIPRPILSGDISPSAPTVKTRASGTRASKHPLDPNKTCKHKFTKASKAGTLCDKQVYHGYDYCPSCLGLVSVQNELVSQGISLPPGIKSSSTKGNKKANGVVTSPSTLPLPGAIVSNGLPQEEPLQPVDSKEEDELVVNQIVLNGNTVGKFTRSGTTFIAEINDDDLGDIIGVMDGNNFRQTVTSQERNILTSIGLRVSKTLNSNELPVIESDLPVIPSLPGL